MPLLSAVRSLAVDQKRMRSLVFFPADISVLSSLQCSDAVGLVTGRIYLACKNQNPQGFFSGTGEERID